MKKRIIAIIFIILFVTVGLLVYFGQKSNQKKELYYSGTIDTTQANLSFQIPGRVAQVLVQEGQPVTKNQIVAVLDREEFESRYAQAKAKLEQAKIRKNQLETYSRVHYSFKWFRTFLLGTTSSNDKPRRLLSRNNMGNCSRLRLGNLRCFAERYGPALFS